MRLKLTPAFVKNATAADNAERSLFWDSALPGFGLMVTAKGQRSFVFQFRLGRISRRITLKRGLGLEAARKEVRILMGEVAKGRDPLSERRREGAQAANSLRSIAEEYLSREASKLRSIDQRRACLTRLVFPKFGSRQIDSIRRSEIVRLLDKIQDENGPVMADHTLAILRRLMTWHAGRSDDFRSPIVRGMARTSTKDRARHRTLTDDELRAVWGCAEGSQSTFGHLVQFWLLTATRRNEAARMRREELDGVDWLIPGSRHKSKRDFLVPLAPAAMAVLSRMTVVDVQEGVGFVFSTDGKRPLSGFSKFKRKFDESCGVTGWTLHDLRRTGRSLMSRAGVSPDHAERATGHVIPGVRGTYDRHEYRREKAQALAALADQIDRIVNSRPTVVPLRVQVP